MKRGVKSSFFIKTFLQYICIINVNDLIESWEQKQNSSIIIDDLRRSLRNSLQAINYLKHEDIKNKMINFISSYLYE